MFLNHETSTMYSISEELLFYLYNFAFELNLIKEEDFFFESNI